MVRLSKKFQTEIKDQVHFWFSVILTGELIQQIAEKCPPNIRQELRRGVFDTYVREYFGDCMVQVIMTPEDHWPCNFEADTPYSRTFSDRLVKACGKHGLECSRHPKRKLAQ